eukprot:c22526_g2_i1 orf=2-412(-)
MELPQPSLSPQTTAATSTTDTPTAITIANVSFTAGGSGSGSEQSACSTTCDEQRACSHITTDASNHRYMCIQVNDEQVRKKTRLAPSIIQEEEACESTLSSDMPPLRAALDDDCHGDQNFIKYDEELQVMEEEEEEE